jgi:hypothetical protein
MLTLGHFLMKTIFVWFTTTIFLSPSGKISLQKVMITINEIAKPKYTHKFKTNHTYKISHILQLLGNVEDVTSNF